ncbi:unnamed protein product [Closterium sp. NIES-64]|nr:unnamed protein product [Closterium sp. NIES-65]CAI5986387.1 unnamed protein product [Closterium sp. NIES-64]
MLHPVELTPSGRPVLFPGEVESLLIDDAGIEFEEVANSGSVLEAESLRDGVASLTTHRLIWIDERPATGGNQKRAFAVPLVAIANASAAGWRLTSVFASPRVRMYVLLDPQGRAVLSSSAIGSSSHSTQSSNLGSNLGRTASLVAVLRGQAPADVFLKKLNEALAARKWQDSPFPGLVTPPTAASASLPALPIGAAAAAAAAAAAVGAYGGSGMGGSATGGENPLYWGSAGYGSGEVGTAGGAGGAGGPPPVQFSTAMAGVGGILRREAEQKQATDRSLQEAFSDLNALMAKASEMVKLAERMRQKLQQQQGAASGEIAPSLSSSSSSSSAAAASEELQDLLLKMGIESPVTRETAGALYHRQLSRELADFIGPVLEKTGGTMLLVDVYCIFNRARGTELISPDDLLKACSLWSSFTSPAVLRRFDSGILVVQLKTHSDEHVTRRIQELVSTNEAQRVGVSIADVAQALGVSPAVAKEELLAAEAKALLCRDDAADGLRFFENFFATAHM